MTHKKFKQKYLFYKINEIKGEVKLTYPGRYWIFGFLREVLPKLNWYRKRFTLELLMEVTNGRPVLLHYVRSL